MPGDTQYSVLHAVAHGPLPQMQLAMYWKYVLPPQFAWQQLKHPCLPMGVPSSYAAHCASTLAPQAPPLPLPEELPLLDPELLVLPELLPLLEPEPLPEPELLPLLEPELPPLLEPELLPLVEPEPLPEPELLPLLEPELLPPLEPLPLLAL